MFYKNIHLKPFYFFSVLIISLFYLQNLHADPILIIQDKPEQYSIGPHWEILEDKKNILSFSKVSSSQFDKKFKTTKENFFNFGLSSSTYWLRFKFLNKSNYKNYYLESDYTQLDYLELYIPSTSTYKKLISGDRIKFSKKALAFRTHTFPLLLKTDVDNSSDKLKFFYLKIKTQSTSNINLKLFRDNTFTKHYGLNLFIIGMFIGIIFIMILYNLFIYISLRDISYLYYIISLVFIIIASLSGFGIMSAYVYPEYPMINHYVTPFSLIGVNFSFLQFARSFLKTEKNLKIIDKLLKFQLIVYIIFFFSVPFLPYSTVMKIFSVLAIFYFSSLIYSGIKSIKIGYHSAKFFLFAWIFMLLGLVLRTLVGNGLIVSNIFTLYAIQYGAFLGIVLLSLALANKIKNLIREKDQVSYQLSEARLHALQNRMSPHFLFNSLNSIYSMMDVDPVLARNTIIKLADTYHFQLDQAEKEVIQLDEEITFLKSYLNIMDIRFSNRLKVNLVANADTREIDIPPLIIQPLVEIFIRNALDNFSDTIYEIKIVVQKLIDGCSISIVHNYLEYEINDLTKNTIQSINARLMLMYENVELSFPKKSKLKFCEILTISFFNKIKKNIKN